jgi:hypothetical protein
MLKIEIIRGKYLVGIAGLMTAIHQKGWDENGHAEVIQTIAMGGVPFCERPVVDFDSPLLKKGFECFYQI